MVGVAQLVEHRVVASVVVGSNPITHPISKPQLSFAQLRRYWKLGTGYWLPVPVSEAALIVASRIHKFSFFTNY